MNNYRYLCAKISLFLSLFLIVLMPLAISSVSVFPYITLKERLVNIFFDEFLEESCKYHTIFPKSIQTLFKAKKKRVF